ncbi:hypothetical protein ESCO_003666 [Escovopsis weberi]|uniref:Uncharacterized protein n=1 Tax=Escovopsis weberi TaxID=150374 RepID=A0A0M8N0Z4_ESCWE|nr:hypothetical protein ESCO_003666 [Escovopsis weberi]
MDNVALLTPSRLKATLSPLALSQILPFLPPALRRYHLLLHRQLGALGSRAHLLVSAMLLCALHAAGVLAVNAALVARLGLAAAGSAAARVLCSKTVRMLRAKMVREFFVFILGCGNSVILVVFWPGWILVGAALLALCIKCG